MFKMIIVLSSILAFSLQSSITLWVSLELNFLCFIGILGKSAKKSFSNSVIYYFLIQALGSVIMLMSLLLIMLGHSGLLELTFLLALVLKLGAPPFQFWYLKMIQKLSWGLIWVLSIWQKLIPLILISMSNMGTLLIVIGGLSASFGSFGSVKQKKIKKVLGLSSIFSLGWVIISIVESKDIWLKFMMGYGGALMCLMLLLSQQNFSASSSTYQLLKPLMLLILFLGLLMVSGVPPFIGFFLKVMVLEVLMLSNLFLSLSLLLLSLLLIYTYLMIGFYLLTFIVVTTTTNKLTISQSRLLIDLVLLNLLVMMIFMNIIY